MADRPSPAYFPMAHSGSFHQADGPEVGALAAATRHKMQCELRREGAAAWLFGIRCWLAEWFGVVDVAAAQLCAGPHLNKA